MRWTTLSSTDPLAPPQLTASSRTIRAPSTLPSTLRRKGRAGPRTWRWTLMRPARSTRIRRRTIRERAYLWPRRRNNICYLAKPGLRQLLASDRISSFRARERQTRLEDDKRR